MAELLPGEAGSLSAALEAQHSLRQRMLRVGQLTQWLNDKAIGIKSVKAMALNHVALEVVADWWCRQYPTMVTAIKINEIRAEVGNPKQTPDAKLFLLFISMFKAHNFKFH